MVAGSNPLAYYKAVEQCCRLVMVKGGSTAGLDPATIAARLGGSLLLPGLLSGDVHAKLLPSWEHSKAYLSAVASCVKGMICAAQQQQEQLGVGCVQGSEQQGLSSVAEHEQQMKEEVAAGMFKWFPYMLTWLATEANSMTADPIAEPFYAFVRRTRPLEANHLFTPRGIQLVALLWLARGVNAAGQLLLPCKRSLIAAIRARENACKDPQVDSSRSTSTSHLELGSSSSGGGESSVTTSSRGSGVHRTSTSHLKLGCSSSSSSGGRERSVPTSSRSSGVQCTSTSHVLGSKSSSGGRGSSMTNSSRGSGVQCTSASHFELGSSSSSSEGGESSVTISSRRGSGMHCSGASSSREGIYGSSGAMSVENIMDTIVSLTWCTEQVHLAASERGAAGEGGAGHSTTASSSSTEAGLSSTAAAVGNGGLPDCSSAGLPAIASSVSSPSSAAPIKTAAVIPKSVPKRLLKLPQNGLPEPIVDQLELIHSQWGVDRLFQGFQETVAQPSGEQKVEYLFDMLKLAELLLTEVPNPLGCSYPCCVNMSGESEVGSSNKACLGCKMVYYCSKRCQVAHWGTHKHLCKRFKKQQETPEQEQEGKNGSGQNGKQAQQQQTKTGRKKQL